MIIGKLQVQHVLLLAAHHTLLLIGRKKRAGSQEIRSRDNIQNISVEMIVFALFPIFPEFKIIHSEYSCDEFENRKRYAALVHILKNLAHRFLRRVLVQADDRNFVMSDGHYNFSTKSSILVACLV